MPFIDNKCPNCGAFLNVNLYTGAANCPSCGSTFLNEDSIKGIRPNSYINRLEAADTYLSLEKYDAAQKCFKDVVDQKPQDYRGWYGLFVSSTHNFKSRCKSKRTLLTYEDWMKTVSKLNQGSDREEVLGKMQSYLDSQREQNKAEVASINGQIKEKQDRLNKIDNEINRISGRMSGVNDDIYRDRDETSFTISFIAFLVLSAVALILMFSSRFMGLIVLGIAFFVLIKGVFVKSFKINNALSGHQAEQSRLSGKRTDLYTERTDVQDALMELNRMLTEYD